jgi:hypothetical protein
MPHFTAHQVVAVVLMVHWTVLGFSSWTGTETEMDDGGGLPLILRPDRHGLDLAQRSMGALWLWDIPVSVLTRDMATSGVMDAVMHAHHMGMLLVTCVVLGCLTFPSVGTHDDVNDVNDVDGGGGGTVPLLSVGSCLAYIFFGRIELSSIPLQLIDLCHPKKSRPWYEYANRTPWLSTVVEVCRGLFAVSFLAVRGVYFPYTTVRIVVPDFWNGVRWAVTNGQTQYVLPMVIILLVCVPFTILQLYWAVLVCRQMYRAVVPADGGGDRNQKEQ